MPSSSCRRAACLLPLAGLLLAPAAASAAGPVVRDQSALDFSGHLPTSEAVTAADFVLTGPGRVTGATVWLVDTDDADDGVLGSLEDELSWAIYTNAAGVPGTLVRSGRTRKVDFADTGEHLLDGEVFRVHFHLGLPVSLAAGTYWLALHEGLWLSAGDGTPVNWLLSSRKLGAGAARSDSETAPGGWVLEDGDPAFVVETDRILWDQSAIVAGSWGAELTTSVTANDFELAAPGSFSSLEAWLADTTSGDDGVLQTFSGTLSWAVYASDGPSGKPGSELASGEAGIEWATDAEVQADSNLDVVRVQIPLGRSVALPPGVYWLALHEGDWLAASDGSEVLWYQGSASALGGIWMDANEQAPGAWATSQSFECAFVLLDDLLFASGFEAGAACAWSNAPGDACVAPPITLPE